MKKCYHYVAVAFAFVLVTVGLSIDFDQNYSMGGWQKVAFYIVPILILYIEMIYQQHQLKTEQEKLLLQRKQFIYMFSVYMIAVVTLLFLGSSFRRAFADRNIWEVEPFTREHLSMYCNFRPLKTIRMYIHAYQRQSMSMRLILANIFGNLAVFMPCAIFMPVIWQKKMTKFRYFLPTITMMVVTVELIQFFTMVGQADVDDVILNVTGACVIYFLRPLLRRLESFRGVHYLIGSYDSSMEI